MKRFLLLVLCLVLVVSWIFWRSEPRPVTQTKPSVPASVLSEQVLPIIPPKSRPEGTAKKGEPRKSSVVEQAREQKNAHASKAFLEEALKHDPENSDLLTELGYLYLNGLEQPRKALEFFERVLSKDASNPEVVSTAGNIYLNERLYKRGAAFMGQLRERFPENTTISVAMADLMAKEGRPAEGLEILEDASRRNADAGEYSPYLGQMYLNNGQTGKAVEVFKRLVETRESEQGQAAAADPMQVEFARLDLANAWLAHGNQHEAEAIVRGVLERFPGEPFAKELWARVQKAGEGASF